MKCYKYGWSKNASLLTVEQNVPLPPLLLTSVPKNRNHCMHCGIYRYINGVSYPFSRNTQMFNSRISV